jgi:type I restriction enzyme S subunit
MVGEAALRGKYAAYPEYKDPSVEWLDTIPVHWKVTPIKHVLSTPITDGPHSTPNFIDEGIPFVSAEAVSGGYINFDKIRGYISEEDDDFFSQKYRPQKHDVYMIKSGATTGITAIVETGLRFNIWSPLAVMRCNSAFNPYFLLNSLRADFFQKSVQLSWTFGTQQNIGMSTLENLVVCYPPLVEQQQIANFLDHETAKIDTLIDKQQHLITLLKEKRQAVISHAVTKGLNPNAPMRDSGVEWLGKVPAHWVKKIKLSNLAESNRGSFVNGPFGSDLLADELRDEGVPVVYIRDIKRTGYIRKSTVCVTPAKAEQLQVCKVLAGDVIISKVGDPPGDACIYPEGEPNAIITQDVIRIRVDSEVANPNYLVMLLNSDFGQMVINDISVEGTRKRVSLGDFKATKFVLPPLSEQNDIVDYVKRQCSVMDTLIGKSENAVGLIKERRKALISGAVTGKIDVRNWKAKDMENIT